MPDENTVHHFLSREFLTWLWYKSEERGGSLFVQTRGDILVQFQKRVVLEAGEGEYTETVLCQGAHSGLREGKAALKMGKQVREARILLGVGTQEWEFTFKADRFQFQSVKFPKTFGLAEDADDMEGRTLERISLMEEPVYIMERLFEAFLERRVSPEWREEDLPGIRKWISEEPG